MNRTAIFFTEVLLLPLAVLEGCGNNRELQAITISPQTADAKAFSNGQVPFSATGTFSQPPTPVPLTSQNIQWCIGSTNGVCDPAMPTYPSLDQNGLAQCGTFVGTATVVAGSGASGVSDAAVFKVYGSAQLTCP